MLEAKFGDNPQVEYLKLSSSVKYLPEFFNGNVGFRYRALSCSGKKKTWTDLMQFTQAWQSSWEEGMNIC